MSLQVVDFLYRFKFGISGLDLCLLCLFFQYEMGFVSIHTKSTLQMVFSGVVYVDESCGLVI